MNIFDRGYIRAKIWVSNLKDDFKKDERGVSGIVAAVILVLLAVLLAVFFWNNISTFVSDMWDKIDTKADFKDVQTKH